MYFLCLFFSFRFGAAAEIVFKPQFIQLFLPMFLGSG
jgi:hypothetical protein